MAAPPDDPLKRLGLQPGADPADVRRAFRQLAKRYHPDVNGGSAEVFRLICDAYRELLDRRKTNTDSPSDSNGLSGTAYSWKGRDIHVTFRLTLEEAVSQSPVTFRYRRAEPCRVCRAGPDEACPVCLGIGIVYQARMPDGRPLPSPCPRCQPKKNGGGNACPACGGSTLIRRPAETKIKPPAGPISGLRLRLPGQGDFPSAPFHIPGDLYLSLAYKPHPLFIPEGSHLHLAWAPGLWPGDNPRLAPTLYGPIRLARTPSPGSTIVLRGRGLPMEPKHLRGDLFIHY